MKRDPKWTSFVTEHNPMDFATPVMLHKDDFSRTRQEFADECDINNIMDRYDATGVISHVDQRTPMYIDVSDVPDLQSALRVLDEAQRAFMSLPAKVRKEFDNDVHEFVSFAENGENLAKMREWGLAPPEKVPDPPMRVEVVTPPPPAKASE
ncbi:MAG: internal scaffolding protein [Microviridae sp.]|nr:MAG: internal scaffolding protein [Microviridae sp.]